MEEPFLKLSDGSGDEPTTTNRRATTMLRHQQRLVYFQTFYTSSLLLGVMVGFFVECTALAAHVFLMQQLQQQNAVIDIDGDDGTTRQATENDDEYLHQSVSRMLGTSLLWALITSLVPCVVLMTLKMLLQSSLLLLLAEAEDDCVDKNDGDENNNNNKHSSISNYHQLVWQLECRFGIGSFCGVSLASLLVDSLLCERSLVYSRGCVLGMALLIMACMVVTMVVTTTAKDSSTSNSGTSRMPTRTDAPARYECGREHNSGAYKMIVDDNERHYDLETFECSVKKRKLDSVDPEAMERAEIKPGTLKLL